MIKTTIIGAFGEGLNLLNGQTVKTKIISNELEKEYGAQNVWCIDTYGKRNNVMSIFKCIKAFFISNNLVMLPAQNALKILAPLLTILNKLFNRRLHYVVIGGWLNEYLNNHSYVEKTLHHFYGIYVETKTMKESLQRRGFSNVLVIPNCKYLEILNGKELVFSLDKPYKLVTFSRIMKEKGIEDAIIATQIANSRIGTVVFQLVIYGQVDPQQISWFEDICHKYNSFIYGGMVPFDKSTEVIKQSYALLFPTYYDGEGFAGTLIDALASGVPVIASDWKYNGEIIDHAYTGYLFPTHNIDALADALVWAYKNQEKWNNMKMNCIKEATQYLPYIALKPFLAQIK